MELKLISENIIEEFKIAAEVSSASNFCRFLNWFNTVDNCNSKILAYFIFVKVKICGRETIMSKLEITTYFAMKSGN